MLNEGVKVNNVCYDKIGIECDDNYGDGNIINVNMSHIKDLLTYYDVVIVPGFIGVSNECKIISLGRNTSDLTGVVICDYFKLDKVNIIKEVDGVYSGDPKKGEGKLISNLSYDEMLLIVKAGSSMFSKKTLEYAKDKGIVIEVKGLDKEKGSIISEVKSNEKILFVNEEPVEENFLRRKCLRPMLERQMGENEFFVLGDNRPASRDSRSVGPIPLENIVAVVKCVVFPFKRIRKIR